MGSTATRVLKKRSLTSCIICMVLAVSGGCSSERTTGPRAMINDGRAVFQGVFFGVGETGRRLDKLWEGKSIIDRVTDPFMRQRAQASMDSVTRIVESRDPTFLSRFASAMQSGQPVIVETSLAEGLSRLRAAAGLADDTTIVIDRAQADVYQVVDIYQYVEIYQILTFYEYATVYRYVAAIEAAGSPPARTMLFNNKSHLARDVLVQEITVAMAAPQISVATQ
jgi:SdpC family antimicrobial peptide